LDNGLTYHNSLATEDESGEEVNAVAISVDVICHVNRIFKFIHKITPFF
jgi:hypothetical protein